MAPRSYSWILLYDDDCGFCRWCLGWVLRLDRRRELNPVALSTDWANGLLADLSPEERRASWHLVAPDGRRWSAGLAAPRLLRLLPGGRIPAAALASALPVTERMYRWIADHRETLGPHIPHSSKTRGDDVIRARVAEIPAEQLDTGALVKGP